MVEIGFLSVFTTKVIMLKRSTQEALALSTNIHEKFYAIMLYKIRFYKVCGRKSVIKYNRTVVIQEVLFMRQYLVYIQLQVYDNM